MRLKLRFFIFVCLVMANNEGKDTSDGEQNGEDVEVEGESSSDNEQTEDQSGNPAKITYDDVAERDFGRNQVTIADDAQTGEDEDENKERIRAFFNDEGDEDSETSPEDDMSKSKNETGSGISAFTPDEEKRCLFVVDLLNFDASNYTKEIDFIAKIVKNTLDNEVLGEIWAYGYTNASEPKEQLKSMKGNRTELINYFENTMSYANITPIYTNE
ncbi:unnamed protein product, partial [Cylicocyclus nassatus]